MRSATAVFVVAFAAYTWTASPAPGWLDSSELVAASASLGVAHSPGHPIPALLGRAATLVPLGDLPFRVALASALMVALAAAAVTLTARRLCDALAPERPDLREPLAAAAGLAFAMSGAAWLQAVRAEVYGLEIALCALAAALLLEPDAAAFRRRLPAAGLAVGLALANHHFVSALFAAPAAIYALARRPGGAALARTAALGVLGLAALAYLPLRAAADPVVNWGDPDTLSRFVWTVSARAFQKSLGAEVHTETRGDDAMQVVAALIWQISLPAMLLVLAGGWAWWRRARARGVLALLLAIAALAGAGRAILGFDFDNPDALGYLLPAVLALLLLATGGLAALAAALPAHRAASAAVVLVATLLPGWQVVAHAHDASRRRTEASDRYAREVLDTLPPRAVVVTSYFETCFQLWALSTVEQARPDVAHLDRGFATYPGMEAAARRRHPTLAPVIDAGLRVGAPAPLAALDALGRPVFFELAPTLDAPLRARLLPHGWLAAYATTPPDAATRQRTELDWEPHAAAQRGRLATAEDEEPGSRRIALWHAYLRAELYCSLGRHETAAVAISAAQRLAPADPTLEELARHCKTPPP